MPTATSFTELENQIRDSMRNAMNVVQSKSLNIMYEEVGSFYTKGKPRRYVRTGNLGSSPRVSSIVGSGDKLSFEAYLDRGHYLVPNPAFTDIGLASYFTTMEVFNAAELGTAHILGKPGFWKRSSKRIEKTIKSTFRSYFR